MLQHIYKEKMYLFLDILAAIAVAVLNVCFSFALGNMTNAAVEGDIGNLWSAAVACVIYLILLYVIQALEMYFRKRLTSRCICAIKSNLYHGFVSEGIEHFHEREDSYYLNILQSDIDTIERDYFDALWRILNFSIRVIFCSIALFKISWKLCIIFAIVSIVPQIVSRFIKKPLENAKATFSKENAGVLQKQKEFIQGFDTILYFSQASSFISRLKQSDEKLEKKRQARDVCAVLTTGGAMTTNMIGQIVCMAAAAYYIAAGELRIGALTSSTQLLNFAFAPLNSVITCVLSILSTKAIRDKIRYFFHAQPDSRNTPFQWGDIVFRNVTLSYGNHTVVRNFSCTFEKSKKYAIVGPSGVGKSTLVKGILRTISPAAGSISIGEVDVQKIDLMELRRNVLYVPQNTDLFQGTVWENISFFGSEKEVSHFAREASLPEDLLLAQAGGDQGQTLSGGEKTRIAIARALCTNTPVVIFDEPTSGLDPDTASDIENRILNINDKTVIVITHNWEPTLLERFDGVIHVK